MKVIIAGGSRTGTTRCYMMLRRLMEKHDPGAVFAGANAQTIMDYLELPGSAVIKSHELVRGISDDVYIVIALRHPYDQAGSMQRINGWSDEQVCDELVRSLRMLESLQRRPRTLVIMYEVFYGYDVQLATLFAHHLRIDVSQSEINEIADACSIRAAKAIVAGLEEEADPITELRRNHIGPHDGRPQHYEIDDALKKKINAIYANWRAASSNH